MLLVLDPRAPEYDRITTGSDASATSVVSPPSIFTLNAGALVSRGDRQGFNSNHFMPRSSSEPAAGASLDPTSVALAHLPSFRWRGHVRDLCGHLRTLGSHLEPLAGLVTFSHRMHRCSRVYAPALRQWCAWCALQLLVLWCVGSDDAPDGLSLAGLSCLVLIVAPRGAVLVWLLLRLQSCGRVTGVTAALSWPFRVVGC
jgi:hypothetical protein